MTQRAQFSLPRVLLGAGGLLIGLLSLSPLAAAQGGAAPAKPAAPQLLDVGPPADSVKEKVNYEAPKEDVLSLNLSAGGALASGNTQAYQLSAGGDFRWVGMPHSISANVLGLLGGAKPAGGGSIQQTTENVNGRLKYELFLTQHDSLFTAVGLRQDRFAGMQPRVDGQIGYGHYFVAEEKLRFWGEAGYDLTFTRYHELPGEMRFRQSKAVHSARVFVGLEHQVHEYLSYIGGFEGFLNMEQPGASRFVFENAVRSTLADKFKLELKARFMYDAKPVVPNAKKLDTAFVVSLMYSVI